ncbi:hypothetical protein BV22DRAFT_885986 [Leucogyrophana mollusca]|uniref:Uncharacterized protein n=1 Tax=Leucogyrophana mollusca TaxID=85980 RepID=A0ACB8AZZ1_9AGAM|nr:hypothetical protein BV22DRAFT_885986 [Leucogyrophana mollusca]
MEDSASGQRNGVKRRTAEVGREGSTVIMAVSEPRIGEHPGNGLHQNLYGRLSRSGPGTAAGSPPTHLPTAAHPLLAVRCSSPTALCILPVDLLSAVQACEALHETTYNQLISLVHNASALGRSKTI